MKEDGWSDDELRASVVAYLEMLKKQNAKEKFVKNKYYRELSERFGRTESSFEYRMENISYVLYLMGHSWLKGLKLAKNVGKNIAIKLKRMLNEIDEIKSLNIIESESKNKNKLDER